MFVTGGVGVLFGVGFLALVAVAWFLENSRWQLSDRLGTALVVLAIPAFYLVWKFRLIGFGGGEAAVAGLLSRFILGLSLVKLFQKKRDRDWLFLYLMAFFELLLSAALSISPIYLGVLVLYLLITAVAVITFEIGKSARSVKGETAENDNSFERLNQTPFRRLPSTAIVLIGAVMICAAPIFFLLPRVGGAGFGANQNGLTGMTGFSERVRLGEIGRIQQGEETVMRVKVETAERSISGLRWRGIALDQFDNRSWKQSRTRRQSFVRSERETFLVGSRFSKPKLVFQTFYMEPMDTSVLFTLPHPILVQGNFPEIRKDEDDGLSAVRFGMERINYSVQSDQSMPTPEQLRADGTAYAADDFRKYLQLPDDLDPRIDTLASDVIKNKSNRYDQAKAVEEFLQTRFGYTLEQKASGEQPVADFLFNVKEGHCEYFSSAMVLMLRTQGIAARIVNGFQQGEYNETAGVFVVKQKDAHSWVEVYFPKDKVWVTFDPTPFAGLNGDAAGAGLLGALGKYVEALETFWIQYFVAYDDQGQKSLFRSVKDGFNDVQTSVSTGAVDLQTRIQQWWAEVRGDSGTQASLLAIGYGTAYLFAGIVGFWLLIYAYRGLRDLKLLEAIARWRGRKRQQGIVEFYDRMVTMLSRRGLRRETSQTPLEFAFAIGIPEAVAITEKYNRVRFGGKDLSPTEADEVEALLGRIDVRDEPS
ncbi:MAG: DUF3488 domain-containing protein [Acidobacteria bacterium]|nr:DUF3488 domain-containing protein [Acidobacteriota bacterium]